MLHKVLVAAAFLAAVARADLWAQDDDEAFDLAAEEQEEGYEYTEADFAAVDDSIAVPPRGPAPDITDENGEQYEHVRADGAVMRSPRYKGCFRDSGHRDMNGPRIMQRNQMTIKKCRDFCAARGYKYAGLEYAYECFCDNLYGGYGRLDESKCNMACTGNPKKKCGGSWALSVYETKLAPYPWVGCFVDQRPRTLPYAAVMKRNAQMSREFCCDLCSSKGYKFCGTEYAYECFCGNTFTRKQKVNFRQCADKCSGAACGDETCGDSWRLSVYRTSGAKLGWAHAYYYGTRAGGAGALAVLALVGWRAYRRRQGRDGYETPPGGEEEEETAQLL